MPDKSLTNFIAQVYFIHFFWKERKLPVYLKNQSIVGLLLRFLLEKNNAPIFSFGIFRTLKEFLDFNEFFFGIFLFMTKNLES